MTQGASLTRNEGAKDRGEHRKVARAIAQGLTARKRRVAGNLNSKPPISGAQILLLVQRRFRVSNLARRAGQRYAFDASANSQYDPSGIEEHGIEFLGLDGVRLLAQSPELLPRGGAGGEVADEG